MKGQLILLEATIGALILLLILLFTQPLFHPVAPLVHHYVTGDAKLLSTPLVADVNIKKG